MTGINWQPIGTAPKDAWVLVYAPDSDSEYNECVGVSMLYTTPQGQEFWPSFREDRVEISPTHWMPLPEPPNA